MLLRITKRKGCEMDDVLEEPAAQDGGLWGRLTSWGTKPNSLADPSLGTGNPSNLFSPACDRVQPMRDSLHTLVLLSSCVLRESLACCAGPVPAAVIDHHL